jgi:hypothetical protein
MHDLEFYCVHMSVCTNNYKSTAHGMDIVKFNHTGFVTADVPFIVSLTMADVKGSGRGLNVRHNRRDLGHEATGWTARKMRFESRQGQETYCVPPTSFSPIE